MVIRLDYLSLKIVRALPRTPLTKTYRIMTQNYFVFTPYEVYTENQLTKEKKKELVSRGAKCMAVVFNCENYEDFREKYFSQIPESPCRATFLID